MSNVTRFGPNPLLDNEIANKAYVDASGSGGALFSRAIQQATLIVNNSIVTVPTDLVSTLNASTRYTFLIFFYCVTNSTSDARQGLTFPSGATGYWTEGGLVTNNNSLVSIANEHAQGYSTGSRSSFLTGTILTDTTPGVMTMTFAQGTAQVFDTELRPGSMMCVWESA